MKIERICKLTASISFIVLAVSVLMAWKCPAVGYEASIYSSTPVIYWISTIVCFACGVSIIIQQIWTGRIHEKKTWIIGLILLFFDYASVMSLQIIRGYVLWSPGDVFSHLGMAEQLIEQGRTDILNFYPITHLLSAQSFYISGMSLMQVFMYLPFVFALLHVLFIGLLAKFVVPWKECVFFVVLLAFIPFHDYYLNMTPNHLSTLLFPFILYLIVRRRTTKDTKFSIIFVLTLILLGPLHPIVVVTTLIFLVTLQLADVIIHLFLNRITGKSGIQFDVFTWVMLIIWGYSWLSSFYFWRGFSLNIKGILTEITSSQLTLLQGQISYASGYGYNIFEYFIKEYGGVLLIIVLTAIDFFIIWREFTIYKELKTLVSFYLPLLVFAIIIITLYFINLGFGPMRFLPYIILLCILESSHILYFLLIKLKESLSNMKVRLIVLMSIVALFTGLWTHALFGLYPSSYVFTNNWQTTKADINGMRWFFGKKDLTLMSTTLSIPPWRFAKFILTLEEEKRMGIPDEVPVELILPSHFGYDKGAVLGAYYEQNTYLLLDQRDKVLYEEIFPELANEKYSLDDFSKLINDITVNRIYSNNGFDAYLIEGDK